MKRYIYYPHGMEEYVLLNEKCQMPFADKYFEEYDKSLLRAKIKLKADYPNLKFKLKSMGLYPAGSESDAGFYIRYDANNGSWFEVYVGYPSVRNTFKGSQSHLSVMEHTQFTWDVE